MRQLGSSAATERAAMTRRSIILAAGGGLIAVSCGGGGVDTADSTTPPEETPDTPDSTPDTPDDTEAAAPPTSADESPDAPAEDALAATSDVPVGGGMVNTDANVVIVQPSQGEFKAFTATCTHQACPLENVENGEIVCSTTCGHGSRFAVADGSVTTGPASNALEEVPVSVDGDSIVAS